eukprot:UC4_evm7s805
MIFSSVVVAAHDDEISDWVEEEEEEGEDFSKRSATKPKNYKGSTVNLELQHYLGKDFGWVKRGVISVKSLSSHHGSIVHENDLRYAIDYVYNLASGTTGTSFYKIRVFPLGSHNPEAFAIEASVDACFLYESRLDDTIILHLDRQGSVQSLEIDPLRQSCRSRANKKHHLKKRKLSGFETSVVVSHGLEGPSPETKSFIEMMERQQEKVRQQKENPSFWNKYWMYITLFVFMLMSGGAEPDNDRRGSGDGKT